MQDGATNRVGGGKFVLHKTTGGLLTLTGSNSIHTGGIIIDGGGVAAGSPKALGFGGTYARAQPAGIIAVNAGGTLDLGGTTGVIAPVNLNGGSVVNNGATPATLSTGVALTTFNSSNDQFSIGTTVNYTGGGGTGATANAVLGLSTTSIVLDSGGTGYTSAPSVSISGSTGASVTANVSGGAVTGFNIVFEGGLGAGFTAVPTVTFGTVAGASGAAAHVVDGAFALTGIAQTADGSGYTSAPSVSFSTGSSGAAATLSRITVFSDSFIGGSGDLTIDNPIIGGGKLTKIGIGTTFLNGNNSYAGTTIQQGTLSITSLNNVSNLGISFTGGLLQIRGTSLTSIDGSINDTTTFSGGFDIADPTNVFTLNTVLDGPGSLAKAGPGTMKILSANNLAGGATLNAGTLLINNTTGSATGSGTVTLNGGTLGGGGTIAGTVAGGTGAHTIAPSANLAPATVAKLTVGGLTTNANTTLAFRLETPNTTGGSDSIKVTGTNTLNLSGGGNLAILENPVGLGSLGYYKAIEYTGSIPAGYTGITRPAVDANKIVYTLDVAHDAGFVDIHRGFDGDANDDGVVNFADFVRLSNNYGVADAGWFGGDFNGDGTTNFADFVRLSNNYGNTVAGGAIVISPAEWAALNSFGAAAAPVPEPASLALLGVGAAALLTKRRRK
jgi:autotransporter-associated beta strand protein